MTNIKSIPVIAAAALVITAPATAQMNKSLPGMSNSSMSSQSAHRSGGASASTGMTGKGHKAKKHHPGKRHSQAAKTSK